MSRLKKVVIGLVVLLLLGMGGLMAGLPGWGGHGVSVAYAGGCDGFPAPPDPDCPPTPTPTPLPGH